MSPEARKKILYAFMLVELAGVLMIGALEVDKRAEREALAEKLRAGDELTDDERQAAADHLHDVD